MNESPIDFDATNIPRFAIFRDRKVRITDYIDGRFWIIDTDDSTRSVARSQLMFLKN